MKLSVQDSVIVIGLHRVVADLDHKTKQLCSRHGLTLGQFAVLESLSTKGDLTVGEVKKLILSSDGTIPVVIGNLEKQGYILRHQDEKDKRKYIISLTESGRDLIETVMPENNRMLTKALSGISKEDKQQLAKIIAAYRKESDR